MGVSGLVEGSIGVCLGEQSAESNASLHALIASGLPAVTFSFCWYQQNINSTSIAPVYGPTPSGATYSNGSTPTMAGLSGSVELAAKSGMLTVLRPMVDLNWSLPENAREYRGDIGKHFDADMWDAWFASYEAYVLQYAELAEDLGVSGFSVGVQLNVASLQEAHWRTLVGKVKTVFSGLVFYSQGGGTDPFAIQWWDATDVIGTDAYMVTPSLSGNPDAIKLSTIIAAWEPRIRQFANASRHFKKPVLVAEFGICSLHHDGIFETPYFYKCSPPLRSRNDYVDLDVQTKYLSAFFEALNPQPWLFGAFEWNWLSHNSDGGKNDSDFTPRGKPAMDLLRANWAQP